MISLLVSFLQPLTIFPVSKRFHERALSYPLEDAPNRRIKLGTFKDQLFKLKLPVRNQRYEIDANTIKKFFDLFVLCSNDQGGGYASP